MLVYPFQPAQPFGYSLLGYDEDARAPGPELYLLPAGQQLPPDFAGSFAFCPAPQPPDGCLWPVQSAPEDAPGVYCDTQLCGGSLAAHLSALLSRWGRRLWVYLLPMRLRFRIPCPTGQGEALSEQALAALLAHHPSHFSPALVCRYCFDADETGAWVVLFDTDETCLEKCALARRLGVQQVFGFLPQQASLSSAPSPTAPAPGCA